MSELKESVPPEVLRALLESLNGEDFSVREYPLPQTDRTPPA